MNIDTKIALTVVNRLSFATLQRYLQNRDWTKKQSKREGLTIFYTELPKPTEILLPISRAFSDYDELIYKAISKIAFVENREPERVINDLLVPPSDVIRFRVENQKTELGLISFNDGFALLENAKKSLFATACDIVNPTSFHKRMSYKNAQQFIDSCFLGQTERGSFVASVVCPFVKETIEEKPIQLSLFNTEDKLGTSFTRKVTKRYMKALARLKDVIETGNHESLEDPNQPETISANFIESIVELGEYGDKEEIEIFTSWSSITKDVIDVPRAVSFTKDYIPPMESIISKLKPIDEGKAGTFVGKVSKAQADPDTANRSEGEITFNFIGDEEKIIKAKVLLNTEDFSKACEALDKGINVKISGLLKTSGKSKIIETPDFILLD
ncbi:hypothetical protein CHISP_2345 [Chitinispirillum alkaliphilum]|nr:hypothetical protein CHISP_2345 [Chitinispirillum alkaliphilum]